MRAIWEFEITQKFEGIGEKYYIESFIGKEDLYQTLVERIPRWKRQVIENDDQTEHSCVKVTVLSAKKICDLTT